MNAFTRFEISGPDSQIIVGDRLSGTDRQLLFITGFLSKRWGNKSKALVELCQERGWGFCCFDFRGNGDSGGTFHEYTLNDWLEDSRQVLQWILDGPPVTIIGSSLGGWLAWLLGQEVHVVQRLILLAPAFNMMGKRAREIPPERRKTWQTSGWMPWDDDALHRDFPLSWRWVEESESLWAQRLLTPRRVPTTILHGLEDRVILPEGSLAFTDHLFKQDSDFPIELMLKSGDHRLSSQEHLETLIQLASVSS